MQNNINLDEITDIKELKALAFDQIQILEQAQTNLRNIQARMQQVGQEPPKELEPETSVEQPTVAGPV